MSSQRELKKPMTTWERWTRKLPDLDDLMAYDTVKEVRVLDRRLGFIYYFVLISVFFYVVIYVFLIRKQYLAEEKTTGLIITKVINTAHDNTDMPWDVFDAVTNPGEQGAAFVPTRVVVTKGQVQEGFCESPLHTCKSNHDCDIGNEELQQTTCSNGRCMRRQWCPAEELGKPNTQEYIVNSRTYDVWFETIIHFHQFQLDVASTDDKEPIRYPAEHANTYPLHDLMRFANVDMKSIERLGAIIQMNNIISCDLDAFVCKTQLVSSNIDTKTGFNYVQNYYYFENGIRKRDAYHFYGIRIIATATGFGTKTSVSNTVLQVSSAIALLTTAQTLADVFLQYVVPERNHYKAYKIQTTEELRSEDE